MLILERNVESFTSFISMTWVSYGTESHVCQKAQWVKRQQQLILVICVFAVGLHYLHSEAPIKVIHRDLKSRNGKIFHLQSCHYYICALGQTPILELFYFLSSSCCDCRQSPEGGFTSWPAHSQSAVTLSGLWAFSCSVWTQEGSDLLSMRRTRWQPHRGDHGDLEKLQ